MITQVRGVLKSVSEEDLTLEVPPWELQILIPEMVRRQLQSRLNEPIVLQTMFYIEGNATGGKMTPRLVGFLNANDREFFDVFCSVDGVGVKKALRAMCVPVSQLARTIQDSDLKTLATFPGIGEAMAERIVAKLRRKVGKFALTLERSPATASKTSANGSGHIAPPEVIQDAYAMLISLGHTESQARQALDRVLVGKKKYATVPELIEAVYSQNAEAEKKTKKT